MKVLAADDSATQRRLLRTLLQGSDVEVVEAATGSEALDHLLRPGGPSIALLDWEMPEFTGVELCRKIRAANLHVRPHLILVTSRTDRADVVQALEAGADDFLSKPVHPPELHARVQVGVRNVKLQLELQERIGQLEGALHRLDVVGAVAAGATPTSDVAPAHRTGSLSAPLEALDGIRGLPTRFAAALGSLQGDEPAAAPELWAHLSLALPAQGAWLDLTLEVARAQAARAFARVSGRAAASDQSLLDGVCDVLTLVSRGVQQQLEAHGVSALKPMPAKAFVGTLALPESPHRLALTVGGWTLRCVESAAPIRQAPFQQLTPGTVLAQSLTPPSLPSVEVLAKGTLLKPSYLTRAAAFFRGDAANALVPVVDPSAFSKQHHDS